MIRFPLQLEYEKILNKESTVDKYWATVRQVFNFEKIVDASNIKDSLPSIFLIGAMKAGSTTLHDLLTQHPQVRGGFEKETHFFDRPHYIPNAVAYLRQWRFKTNHRAKAPRAPHPHLIESTPMNIMCPLTPYRLKSLYDSLLSNHAVGHQRQFALRMEGGGAVTGATAVGERPFPLFLAILRDPVSRAYSQCWHEFRCSAERFDAWARDEVRLFREFERNFNGTTRDLLGMYFFHGIETEDTSYFQRHFSIPLPPHKYLEDGLFMHAWHKLSAYRDRTHSWPGVMFMRSIYVYQLRNWLAVYPMQHFHIMETADLYPENVVKALRKAFHFLGVEPFDVEEMHSNVRPAYEPMLPSTREFLEDFFRPFDEELSTLLGRRLYWQKPEHD